LMVGDTANDLIAARQNGIDTAIVTYGYGNPQDLDPLQPEFRLDSFEQLLALARFQG